MQVQNNRRILYRNKLCSVNYRARVWHAVSLTECLLQYELGSKILNSGNCFVCFCLFFNSFLREGACSGKKKFLGDNRNWLK